MILHVLQHLIPNVWQLVPVRAPVYGRVIACNGHDLPYGPGDALRHCIHYGNTVQLEGITCGVGMVINRGGSSLMFLVSVPKSPTCLTDVIYYASQMVTLESVDKTSFVGDAALILGSH